MLIDSSIFLELILEQEKADECEALIEKVKSGGVRCVVSDFNIDSMLLNIESKTKNLRLMEKFLKSLLAYSGLSIYFLSIVDRLKALEHSKKHGLDYEDSITMQAALASGNTKIISFDRHFDNLPIERVEPKDVV